MGQKMCESRSRKGEGNLLRGVFDDFGGVGGFAVLAGFEVELGCGDVASFADGADHVALGSDGIFFDHDAVEMSIGRDPIALVADEDKVAEAFHFVSGIDHGAWGCRDDGCAFGSADVDAVIVKPCGFRAEAGEDGALDGPDHRDRGLGGCRRR